ncbi:hypothetical protein [Kutzneria buriramensis]|uniref:SCO4402 family protein n=1 Tax=Kutzneria buriramensis TaxID=1045776 RepID=UPI0011C0ED63|nr:hypothetical protein [Kutzneria buriramensis]
MAAETTYGPDAEVRRGLRHFAGGAKVWVLPPQWGDGGDSVFVIGRHRGRGQSRYVRIVIERFHLTNFRVRGVYSPAVHRELTRPWKHWDRELWLWDTRELAEQVAQRWNLVSTGLTEVRRPRKRLELLGAVQNLADGGIYRWDTLLRLTPGEVLRNDLEAAAFEAVLALLQRMVGDLGPDARYERYSEDPRWTDVVDAAAALFTVMTS